MQSAVVVPFRGVPDGEVYPKQFAAGDTVTGSLASEAIIAGWAEMIGAGDVATPAPAPAPEFAAQSNAAAETGAESEGAGDDAELDEIMNSLASKKPTPAGEADKIAAVLAGMGLRADWRESLSWPKRRSMASDFSAEPIRNGDDANAAIEAEIAKRLAS